MLPLNKKRLRDVSKNEDNGKKYTSNRLNLLKSKGAAEDANSSKAYAFGRAVMQVEGLNFQRLLTALGKLTTLKNIKQKEKILTFSAPAKDVVKIIALLNNLCYTFNIVKYMGMPTLISLAKRVGIVAGLFCAICALIVYPHLIIKLETTGILGKEAYEILSEYGISEGNFIWNLNESAVADALLKLDGVAYAEVTKRGTRVYVVIAHEQEKDNYVGIGSGAVTAKRTAVVTRIIVFDGTAQVLVGDEVSEGQTLIADFIEVGEGKVPSSASGEVYGVTDYTKTRYFPDIVMTTERGKSKKYSRLSFFGSRVNAPTSPYEVAECGYKVWENKFLFPYTVHSWIFTELTVAERTNSLAEDDMKEETLSSLVTELPAGATVQGVATTLERVEGGCIVTAIASVEERIDKV